MRNKFIKFLIAGIRWPDIIILLAFPSMGAIFSVKNLSMESISLLLFFLIISVLFLVQIFIYNDISDTVRDPHEPSRRARHALKTGLISGKSAGIICIILCCLSLAGYAAISPELAASVLLVEILTFLYSNPLINLKGVPVLSLLILFSCGFLYFLSGWLLFQPINADGILLGIYFAIVLSAGHFSNEIDDLDADREAGIMTNAVFFKEKHAFSAGIILFLLSSILFVYIAYNILNDNIYIVSSILLLLTWTILFIYSIFNYSPFPIRIFRRLYRILYALFCFILCAAKFLELSGYGRL
jgi:4-hydroxybenzoate polyprenyltransferase